MPPFPRVIEVFSNYFILIILKGRVIIKQIVVFNNNCWNAFSIRIIIVIVSITVADLTLGLEHRCWDVFIFLSQIRLAIIFSLFSPIHCKIFKHHSNVAKVTDHMVTWELFEKLVHAIS